VRNNRDKKASKQHPEIVFDSSMPPKQAEQARALFHQARKKAHSHVDSLVGVPEETRAGILETELNFWMNDGIVTPIVCVDDNAQHLIVPEDCEIPIFLHDCLIRLAESYVRCSFVDEDDRLCLLYFSKDARYLANCRIDRQNDTVRLEDWHVETIDKIEHKRAEATGQQGHSTRTPGRNERCPCGSGQKYKKCCRNTSTGTSPLLDKDRFAEELVKRIRKAGETAEIGYDPQGFAILREGEDYCNLRNAFMEYANAPQWRRESVLRNWTRAWFAFRKESPASVEDAKSDILPVVRVRSYFEKWLLDSNGALKSTNEDDYRRLGEFHGIGLAYDRPEALFHIRAPQLAEWNMSFNELHEVALENLKQISRPLKFTRQMDGFYISAYGDKYDSSRLLLPELFSTFDLCGDPVVFAPNRQTLLVSGAEDVRGLTAMANLTTTAVDKPRFSSGIPMRLVGEEWQAFQPPSDHPASAEFHKLWVISMAGEYSRQKRDLDRQCQEQGQDILVASYQAASNKSSGECVSWCVWMEGVMPLLPRTDLVSFVTNDPSDPVVAQWERVEEVFGEHMALIDIYPRRYRTTQFPDAHQLQLLRDDHFLENFGGPKK